VLGDVYSIPVTPDFVVSAEGLKCANGDSRDDGLVPKDLELGQRHHLGPFVFRLPDVARLTWSGL
jgi:hypothetical protein